MRLKKKLSVRATTLIAVTQAVAGAAAAHAGQVICGSPDVIQVDVSRYLLNGLHQPNPASAARVDGLPVDCTQCAWKDQPYHGVLPASDTPSAQLVYLDLHPGYNMTLGCTREDHECPDLGFLAGNFKDGAWRFSYTPACDYMRPSECAPSVQLECSER